MTDRFDDAATALAAAADEIDGTFLTRQQRQTAAKQLRLASTALADSHVEDAPTPEPTPEPVDVFGASGATGSPSEVAVALGPTGPAPVVEISLPLRGERMGVTVSGTDQLARLSDLGALWVRIVVDAGAQNIEIKDRIAAIREAGFFVLVCAWDSRGMPDTLGTAQVFGEWVTSLVEAGADAIEIWRQPNQVGEFVDTLNPSAAAFLHVVTYQTVKTKHPDVLVITAGLAPHKEMDVTGDPANPLNFLRTELLIPGFAQSFDGIGALVYASSDPTIHSPSNPIDQLEEIVKLLPGKQIWITEYCGIAGAGGLAPEVIEADIYDRLDAITAAWGPMFHLPLCDADATVPEWLRTSGLFTGDVMKLTGKLFNDRARGLESGQLGLGLPTPVAL